MFTKAEVEARLEGKDLPTFHLARDTKPVKPVVEKPGLLQPDVRAATQDHFDKIAAPDTTAIFELKAPGALDGRESALAWLLLRDRDAREGKIEPTPLDAGLTSFAETLLFSDSSSSSSSSSPPHTAVTKPPASIGSAPNVEESLAHSRKMEEERSPFRVPQTAPRQIDTSGQLSHDQLLKRRAIRLGIK